MTKTAKAPSMARLTIVLFAITAVVALLLGLVNYITKDRIAEETARKTAEAMTEVMPDASSFTELDVDTTGTIVKAAYDAGGAGYVIQVGPSGFGGEIDMVVGVSLDGTVTGVAIVNMVETSGLGDNAKNEAYRAQYTGGAGPFSVDKDGGEIDALTGATVTSRAVTNGVNAALELAKTLG